MSYEEEEIVLRSTESILESYVAGLPLFTRSLLEKRGRQLALASQLNTTQPRIGYDSIQELLKYGEDMDSRAVLICYPIVSERPKESLSDVREAYNTHRQSWLQSDACTLLTRQVDSLFPDSLNKIVCFGLGDFTASDRGFGGFQARCNTQHAAVETIAKLLRKKREIICYAQDPGYNDNDKEMLRSIGITPIDDPRGFLEVDSNTLVISICPNVPVKQIITDLHPPGAMLWNTVLSEAQERAIWGSSGDMSSEYCTDPDSSRVRTLIQQYQQEKFQCTGSEEQFGDLTIYIRKSS